MITSKNELFLNVGWSDWTFIEREGKKEKKRRRRIEKKEKGGRFKTKKSHDDEKNDEIAIK